MASIESQLAFDALSDPAADPFADRGASHRVIVSSRTQLQKCINLLPHREDGVDDGTHTIPHRILCHTFGGFFVPEEAAARKAVSEKHISPGRFARLVHDLATDGFNFESPTSRDKL